MEESKIVLELSNREAIILKTALAGFVPLKEYEMITIMLYNRLNHLIDTNKK